MHLAYITTDKAGETDGLLCQFAQELLAKAVDLAGVVQTNTDCVDSAHCDMDVTVLPKGPVFRISQSLGKEARGCRLDPEALENAVAAVQQGLSDDTALLIINKFGKHEASGRGFRDLIAEALARDIPVLTGVNRLNSDAFARFAGGAEQRLDPDLGNLRHWFETVQKMRDRAA